MTQARQVPFGEWLPDLPSHDNPGALIALNVVPQARSYRSLNALDPFTNALADEALGSFWANDKNNTIFNFAGDRDALYNLASGITWTDISGASAPYATDLNNKPPAWEFEKFGENILATNGSAPIQKYEMNVDAVFSDLAGSPPEALHIAVVRDFVFLGNIPSQGPNFVRWSGYNNATTWTPSIRTQSDFQELFGRGGAVQRIVPGDYGIIFMEQSIFRCDYVGPPVIWQFDELERKRGTPAPYSVVWSGPDLWYYGWDGFYHFNGQSSTPISHNRVSRWFELNADSGVINDMRGVVDRVNRLVIWAFKSSGSAATNDRLIIYNWGADKWSYAEIETQLIEEYVPPGFTLDELDGPLPGGIDLDSIPVDTDAFTGGFLNIQAFDTDNRSATFSGMPLQAIIDTKEISGPDQKRIMCNGLRPLIEGSDQTTVQLQVGKRNSQQANVTFTAARSQNGINGEFSIRENSRYQRYRMIIDGGFIHGNGAKANLRIAGKR